MILTFAVSGYRSLRSLVVPLDQLTVITGSNGSGKSNLYKAIRLLGDVAQGRAVNAIAMEGGITSALWAGPESFSRGMKSGEVPVQGTRRKHTVNVKLGFADEDYGYAIELGLPQADRHSLFNHDPEIKSEVLWAGPHLRRSNDLAVRKGPGVQVRDGAGSREQVLTDLPPFYSMMTHAADPRSAPEILALRERMQAWRFYDRLRTDPDAPARHAQIGTRTPVLSSDGADVAAALQTILEIGDPEALQAAIEDAFPGSSLEIETTGSRFEVVMHQHGLLRPLRAPELSDGTLRYILLVAALLTPRPPPLLVLNEPETSLHPSLLEPLARLIAQVSQRSQTIVVSHAGGLVEPLQREGHCVSYHLRKELGETVLDCEETPKWEWLPR